MRERRSLPREELDTTELQDAFEEWLQEEETKAKAAFAEAEARVKSFVEHGFDLRAHLSASEGEELATGLADPTHNQDLTPFKPFLGLLLQRELRQLEAERFDKVWSDREAFLELFQQFTKTHPHYLNEHLIALFGISRRS